MSQDVIPPQIEEDFPPQTKELNHDPGFVPSLHAGLIYSPSDLLPDKGRPCISVRIAARHLYLLSTYAPIAHLPEKPLLAGCSTFGKQRLAKRRRRTTTEEIKAPFNWNNCLSTLITLRRVAGLLRGAVEG